MHPASCIASPFLALGALPGSPTLHLNANDALRQTVGGSLATTNGAPVGEWVARVGTSPTQATAGKRLELAISGNRRFVACTGDADEGFLSIVSGLSIAQPLTIFLSVLVPSPGNDGCIIKLSGDGAITNSFGFGISGDGTLVGTTPGYQIVALNDNVAWIPTGLSVNPGELTPIVVTIPTSGNIMFHISGASYSYAAWALAGINSYALSIGGYNSGVDLRFSSNALVREVGMYSSILSADQINALLTRTL